MPIATGGWIDIMWILKAKSHGNLGDTGKGYIRHMEICQSLQCRSCGEVRRWGRHDGRASGGSDAARRTHTLCTGYYHVLSIYNKRRSHTVCRILLCVEYLPQEALTHCVKDTTVCWVSTTGTHTLCTWYYLVLSIYKKPFKGYVMPFLVTSELLVHKLHMNKLWVLLPSIR